MVGICGTAMGGVATLLKQRGYVVSGSDAGVYPPMSTLLAEHGISVREGFSPDNLDPTPDLVVIGNAMSRGNEEVEAVLERRLRYVSLAEVLKEFFIHGRTSIVVTGTHGKTTTSSLLAAMLESAGKEPGFMIGGVPDNFGIGAHEGGGVLFVSEGDEYDTAFFDKRSKFLHYLPDLVIVNNVEFDHADIFGSIEEIELSFTRMLNIVPRNGLVAANAADERVMRLTDNVLCPRVTFSATCDADWTARDVVETELGAAFTLVGPPGEIRCETSLGGLHNVSNALGAAALCGHLGLSLDEIATGVASFKGVRRRLQRLPGPDGVALYDDFAHHPTAIDETLRAIRARHPDSRVWALFDPRSNTTVRSIFQQELTDALAMADAVMIGAIHRRDSIPADRRLDVDRLVDDLNGRGVVATFEPDCSRIAEHVAASIALGDVVVLMSNGAFGGLSRDLPQRLIDVLTPSQSQE